VHLLWEDWQCIWRPGERRRRGEKKREGRNEKRGEGMDKRTPCPSPLLWYSIFATNSNFSTQIFQILHITSEPVQCQWYFQYCKYYNWYYRYCDRLLHIIRLILVMLPIHCSWYLFVFVNCFICCFTTSRHRRIQRMSYGFGIARWWQ
jgi:hypothetical protein